MAKISPGIQAEIKFWRQGLPVAGIDEAGRGALAGPVVAAAVILPVNYQGGLEIADSKLLSAQKREELYDGIISAALAWSVGICDHGTIDRINILQATFEAMKEAVSGLSVRPRHLLIDGNRFCKHEIPYTTIVDGDALCLSVAAASIIAKVTRDRLMTEFGERSFPLYKFEENKGYGTKYHREMLISHGECEIHRKTFLRKIFAAGNPPEAAIAE